MVNPEIADLFKQSFRDRLILGDEAVGSDGATWRLGRCGERGRDGWGFSRRAPGVTQWIAWSGMLAGMRHYKTPVEAVDDLEHQLKAIGYQWIRNDEWWAARHARVELDKARILAAVPEGYEVTDYGGHFAVARRDRSGRRLSVYECDLANVEGHADNAVAAMTAWANPERDDEPEAEAPTVEPDGKLI